MTGTLTWALQMFVGEDSGWLEGIRRTEEVPAAVPMSLFRCCRARDT